MNNIVVAQDSLLSPKIFGLMEAKSDTERYEVLYMTHVAAIRAGSTVDYSGIDTLTIEVPLNAECIPLGAVTDFKGLTLRVKNRSKLCYLFERKQSGKEVAIDKALLDGKDLSSVPDLAVGLHQVVVEDQTPWVAQREGYKYSAIRRDILLVCDGLVRNSPVTTYNNEQSNPKCTFCQVDENENPVVIQNITILRDEGNTYKILPFRISHQNNLMIKNVTIKTPSSTLVADAAIDISNCTNVTFENVTIDGSYSRSDYYGYGIQMNNVWNSRFIRLKGHAPWGIFGTNNINTAFLQECDINRFDIHCYGRDVEARNCKFSNLYNQFSSMYGKLIYRKCRFVSFVPVLLETSYNAYTPFDVVMEDCVFDAGASRNYFISAGKLDAVTNTRPELAQKRWPNISIKNMTVNVPGNVSQIVVYKPNTPPDKGVSVNYLSKIQIDGMKFNYSGSGQTASLYLCSRPVPIARKYDCQISRLDILPMSDAKITQATKKYSYPASLIVNLRNSSSDQIKVSKSRLNYNVEANDTYNIVYDRCTIGMIRYTSKTNGTKRTYKNCNLYLNCNDDAFYYIDNHAVYSGCLFVGCDPKRKINFTGTHNDVVFKDCRVKDHVKLLFKGSSNNKEFKSFTLKGKR